MKPNFSHKDLCLGCTECTNEKIPGEGLKDDEWEDVFTATEVSKPWEPIEPKEGNVLFIQIAQGKFAKYVFENGRYNLVGEIE